MIYIFICIWVLFWIRLYFIWESCSFFSEYFSWLIRGGGVRGSGQLGHIHFWWVVIIKSDKPSLTFPSWQSLNEEEEGFSKFPLGFAKKKKKYIYIFYLCDSWQAFLSELLLFLQRFFLYAHHQKCWFQLMFLFICSAFSFAQLLWVIKELRRAFH